MYCKLILTGTKEIIDVVDIPFIEMTLGKPDLTFSLDDKRYKVINHIMPAIRIVFDEKGRVVYNTHHNVQSIEELKATPLLELYITELPTF